MLGKLIKNEMKAGLHSVAFIYLAALAAGSIMAISLMFDITLMVAISMVAIFVIAIAIVVITFASLIVNFNKTLYRDQGYLTFTLPVTSGQLIFAKALCSFIWLILSYAVAIGMLLIAAKSIESYVGEEDIAYFKIVLSMFAELPSVGLIIEAVSLILIKIFIVIVALVAQVFFAVSLSNVKPFQSASILWSIVLFIVFFTVTTLVASYLQAYFPLSLQISAQAVKFSNNAMSEGGIAFGIADSIFELIYGGVFFVLSAWFMNHKINLK